MKKILLLMILIGMLVSCSEKTDKFVGLWNKDFNKTYDLLAYPDWTALGAALPFDAKVVSSPVFIRLWKEGEYYKVTGYTLDVDKKVLKEEVMHPANARFKKVDENTLEFDSEAINPAMKDKLSIHFDDKTGLVSLRFPISEEEKEESETSVPGYEKPGAHFRSMISSGFHKVMEVDGKAEAMDIQE